MGVLHFGAMNLHLVLKLRRAPNGWAATVDSPDQHAQAWAAALTLIVFVLAISVLARLGAARHTRKLRGGSSVS